MTKTLTLPTLHPGQKKVWTNRTRYNVLACGRRWGKSKFFTFVLCVTAIDGYPAGYFAPTYKLLREVFEECRRRLEPAVKSANLTEKRIELLTGGVIEFWTLDDPDAGRSRKYKVVVIDEAGLVKNLGETYNSAIRATLTDYRGDLWIGGTPKGKGWFFSAFQKGIDPENKSWSGWQMPTTSNTTLRNLAQEIEEARSEMPERLFRQEYEAEFLDDAGGVFLGVGDVLDSDGKGRASSIGIDLAKVEDFTVLTALTSEGKQIDIERFNRMDWDRQEARICAFIDRHPEAVVWMDETGVGDPIVERIRKRYPSRVRGMKLTSASKTDIINALALAIEQRTCSLLPNEVQENELRAYEYTFNPRTRNVSMNAPEGMHDDTVIALALANWGITRTSAFEWVAY